MPEEAPKGPIPSPLLSHHVATYSRRRSRLNNPSTANGLGTGTPLPSPQIQSFSQSYESILPTFFAYIVPLIKGCSPWTPDTVMSTIGCRRSPPEFPLASPRSGTVYHLLGPNSPTLGEFYFTMKGRADIEGLKNNVAMDTWPPQASYPCDDEAFGYLKRVIVIPAVYPRLVEFLHFDIQSTGKKSHSVPEGAVPSPFPDRHAMTRSHRGSKSNSPSTADKLGTGTFMPSPQSESFSRSYGSILPTFLTYIVP
ncbi:Hypothetical predicted protein [Olea europaea subsp. europaea]|uniref:Uncharacterized protein n=1 Tax=Olea europaea subsp. europaea TaxID=158383 RepID=A0A8S0T5F6_OLEEU|nr:Hypothetical predicted protein [Olea europaea subsp. europaea]